VPQHVSRAMRELYWLGLIHLLSIVALILPHPTSPYLIFYILFCYWLFIFIFTSIITSIARNSLLCAVKKLLTRSLTGCSSFWSFTALMHVSTSKPVIWFVCRKIVVIAIRKRGRLTFRPFTSMYRLYLFTHAFSNQLTNSSFYLLIFLVAC